MANLSDPNEPTMEERAEELAQQLQAAIIGNLRVYDLLAVIAHSTDPQNAKAVLEAHKQGKLVGPPLWFNPDEAE